MFGGTTSRKWDHPVEIRISDHNIIIITFMRARDVAFPNGFSELFSHANSSPGVQFAQFVLHRINRVRVMSARFNSTVNQTGNLTILRPLPAISNESSSDFYWNFTLRLLQMATSCCNAGTPRHCRGSQVQPERNQTK